MKTISTILVALCISTCWTKAQTAAPAQPVPDPAGQTGSKDAPYAVADRGANHRVWQRTTYETTPDGKQIPQLHQYTELATGLHYRKNGQWVESKEEIEILPDGTAAATRGQHQAYFPANIYQGVIEMVTPDGKHLKSRPLGLSYDDGTHNVLIAELKDSVGQLVGSNQVIYPDAFTDINADLRYTYTKAGFEQDVVLREQPIKPESYGLNPATARLQVLTEFFNPPEPAKSQERPGRQDGSADPTLTFGAMKMNRGKAFLVGDSAQAAARSKGIPVSKSWQHLSGRSFLVEELPVQRIRPQLEKLPASAKANTTLNSPGSIRHKVSATRLLPPVRLVQTMTNAIQLARTEMNNKVGMVLDYVTMDSDTNDFTFQGDTTYLISGWVGIGGLTTFEGGTVLKYLEDYSAGVECNGNVACLTGPYRPAVFTSVNDDTVGEAIPGSSGSPAEGGNYLTLDTSVDPLKYLRMSYANAFIIYYNDALLQISDSQFHYSAGNALDFINYQTYAAFNNVLFSQCASITYNDGGGYNANVIYGNHVTADQLLYGSSLLGEDCVAYLTNSILTDVGNTNDMVLCNSVVLGSGAGVYQTVGGGSYYLVTNSPYRDAGTTNIDPIVLADIAAKTTYPPTVYSGVTFSTATNFSPIVPRDTNGAPDLGYHYDPIDYFFAGVIARSNMTFTAGTAVGWFYTWSPTGYGISVGDSATVSLNGTATAPCVFARYNTVQEGGNGQWTSQGWMSGFTGQSYVNAAPTVSGKFAHCFKLSNEGGIIRDFWTLLNQRFTDCEFWIGGPGGYYSSINATNCFSFRGGAGLWWNYNAANLTLWNCTFYGGGITADHTTGSSWPVTIVNCAFDGCSVYMNAHGLSTSGAYCDYNAFVTNGQRLAFLGSHDVIVTNFNWQTSWLGSFYLPPYSLLIDAGSTTASQLGLYHFTTQTNQIPEAGSQVDMGYHYVAVDANGNPLDTDLDGIPDYLEDANGNGVYDGGDPSDWTEYYNGILPNLTIISGNNQGGFLYDFLPEPLVVQVTDAGGRVLANAPLTFAVSNGSSYLYTDPYGWAQSLPTTTDGGGYATVYLWLDDPSGCVIVTAQTGSSTRAVTFGYAEGQVATPVIAPTGGNYAVLQSVTISCATPGAAIYYTLNGNDPTEADTYYYGQPITVTAAMTVKARAFYDYYLLTSGVQTATYAITGAIAAGRKHTLALNYDGRVLAGGSGGNGQIGDGTTHLRTSLVEVPGVDNVVGIAAGQLFSYAWKDDGTAWALAWGDDRSGETGNGTTKHQQTNAVQIANLTSVVGMAGGYHHGLAVDSSGLAWAWGNNDAGQLGDGTVISHLTPAQVTNLTGIVAVAGGSWYSLALMTNGTVWGWGADYFSQIGDASNPKVRTIPVKTVGLTNATAIAAGHAHSLAISNGMVWAWGANGYGQMGWGFTTSGSSTPKPVYTQTGLGSNVVAIAAGLFHSLALRSDGTVWAWGYNAHGQLGDGTTYSEPVPEKVRGLSNVVAIAANGEHSVALKSDGTIVTWGWSNYGQESSYNTTPIIQQPDVHITGWGPPILFRQPRAYQEPCLGGTATMSVGALGAWPLTYQWKKNGVNLTDGGNVSGANTPLLTLSPIAYSDAGFYTAYVGNPAGAVLSSSSAMEVLGPPPITTQPQSQSVNVGVNVQFYVVAAAWAGPLSYQWYFNGSPLSNGSGVAGAQTATLTLSNVQSGRAGVYTVVVTGRCDSTTSSPATLAVGSFAPVADLKVRITEPKYNSNLP